MRYFFSTLLFSTALSLKAQYHDVKLDAGGLIYGHYGIGYEYGWNDYNGIGIRLGYMGQPNFDLFDTDFSVFESVNQFNVSLDYRWYQIPDEGADKKFYGLYARFRSLTFKESLTQTTTSESQFALGVMYGDKWLFRSGLFFEYYGGVGYYLNDDLDLNDIYLGMNYSPIDIRLGLTVGYRLF